MSESTTGIAAIGLKLPNLAIDVREVARLRHVDPEKYSKGLGCHEIALVPPDENVVDLAVAAAERALERWGGDRGRIGLVVVGTETAVDMSRPLSAWVCDRLDLRGAVRSYEVKHACYGGTLALRQALEWRWSGAAQGRAALVIAADVARYAPGDPGEPTMGAGAVAFVVDDARVATVDRETFAFSEPAFDFWRPVGEAYPRVDGPLSLDCYNRAAEACLTALIGDAEPAAALAPYAALCCHAPFPKMVQKAIRHVGAAWGWSDEATAEYYGTHVEPDLAWNRRMGNGYTASLWVSVAHALARLSPGDRLIAFSYGSGFGAEALTLQAGPASADTAWVADIEADLANRTFVDADTYHELRMQEAGLRAAS